MATRWLGGVDLEGGLNASKSADCGFLQAGQEILCRRPGMNKGIEEIHHRNL
jgi:hypothetical protein